MRLSAGQIEATKQEAEHSFGAQAKVQHFFPGLEAQRGFTLTELITILVIAGILAAVAMPRFFDRSSFDSRGYYDQVVSTLRYAQKTAIAQHRFVCVTFGVDSSVTLKYGAADTCGSDLIGQDGLTPYKVTAPSGVTLSGGTSFNFNALGRASAAQSITVGGYTITVEAETGYVH